MNAEHFIAGKDASLESSIRYMQERLESLGFHIEERSWLNPIEDVWSVHVAERDCPLLFTNGKGTSRQAALASALGEFFERLSTNYFWTHYYLGEAIAHANFVHHPDERWFAPSGDTWPKELLTSDLQSYYNPESAIPAQSLVDLNSGNEERGICTVPFVRQRDGKRIWFPVNILANLYVSNGMSAGNTPAEARAQALSEILERHVKFRIIAEGLCLPDVPEKVIARYPRITAGVQGLRDAGFGVLVKDASLGGQYPVMNVTVLNPADQGCFASFGAHPRFEVALERALTELLQGRALDRLGGFPEAAFDMEEVASPQNLESHFVDSSGVISWNFLDDPADFEFCDWNFSATTAEDYAWLVNRIHADGRDIYLAEYSHLGVYACRIVVPNMSEIYPLDDLEWENNSMGNALRPAILALPDLSREECEQLMESLEDLDDQRLIAPLIGLAPDAGSLWKELRVGELKTLVALAVGNLDAALEGCRWLRQFAHVEAERARIYRCIETLLNFDEVTPFADKLRQLYGKDAFEKALALINGESRFLDIAAPGPALEGCAIHQSLLDAYRKVHPSLR